MNRALWRALGVVAAAHVLSGNVLAQIPSAADQIAAAVLAAPEDRRAAAKVLGYDVNGALVTLRQGTNDMVCLADDPKRENLEVNCYHESLEPFMARGRELAVQGVQERNQPRWDEVRQGTLKMPDRPAILYTSSGRGFDAASGRILEEYRRSTIYIPNATTESTGLSTKSSTTEPWIMYPGTPGAHIMITPPRPRPSGSD
jgi:hypothetical protein